MLFLLLCFAGFSLTYSFFRLLLSAPLVSCPCFATPDGLVAVVRCRSACRDFCLTLSLSFFPYRLRGFSYLPWLFCLAMSFSCELIAFSSLFGFPFLFFSSLAYFTSSLCLSSLLSFHSAIAWFLSFGVYAVFSLFYILRFSFFRCGCFYSLLSFSLGFFRFPSRLCGLSFVCSLHIMGDTVYFVYASLLPLAALRFLYRSSSWQLSARFLFFVQVLRVCCLQFLVLVWSSCPWRWLFSSLLLGIGFLFSLLLIFWFPSTLPLFSGGGSVPVLEL